MSATSVKALAHGRKTLITSGLSEDSFGEPVLLWRGERSKDGGCGLQLKILAGVLLALCASGVIRAQKWERLGPEGGMVVSLGAGLGNVVYLGTADGHVFASNDGARSWALRGRVGRRLDAVVTRMVVDPRDGDRIFAAVWYQEPGSGGGVFESEDRGQSWKLVGLEGEAVRALEIAPSQPDELVAGTRSGVFRSVDRGKSWARISLEGDQEIRNLDSLAIDPRDPEVIYAGTYHLPWLTRDGGKNWKPVIAGIIDDSDIMSLRLDAANPELVYMSACSGIYRSENQGGEWTKLQGIPYAARRTQVIVQDPASPKTLYAGTTEGLWVTRDGGENWARTTSKDWVVNGVVVLGGKNGEPGRVVLGTEGRGVQVSDDAGVSFAEANRGFTHVVVKQLIAEERHAGHLLMVVERSTSEIQESDDDGKSWTSLSLTAVERGKPSTLNIDQVQEVLDSPWGWLLRFENGQLWMWEESKKSWKEWKLLLPAPMGRSTKGGGARAAKSEAARRLTPGAAIVFSQDDAVVSTNEGLMRCQGSGSCARIKAYGRGGKVSAVWVSTTGREIGVVTDGKFGWSSDGGESAVWRDLPVTAERVVWLDVAEPGSEKTVYLGTSRGIFASRDAGVHWQSVEGGLPTGRVEQWLRHPGVWGVSERDGGLYISQDNGATWKRVDQDAERGRFTGLAVTPSGAVLAGSQSEGLLRLELEKTAGTGER
jgi:photosystem II stability/assembly factor-like uncharacterized protein